MLKVNEIIYQATSYTNTIWPMSFARNAKQFGTKFLIKSIYRINLFLYIAYMAKALHMWVNGGNTHA